MIKALLIYLIFVNIAAFGIMGTDKRKARKHSWRTSEKSIFIIGFIGGGLGVLFGMRLFHHKTKHIEFTLGIPVIILLNIVMFGYLMQKLQ